MRILSILFWLLFSLLLTAQQSDCELTIQEQSISLAELLDRISADCEVQFSFNSSEINPKQEIALQVKEANLKEVLQLVSKQINCSHNFIGKQVILKPIEQKNTGRSKATIFGFVSDQSTGEHLIGVTMLALGDYSGAVSNAFGYYTKTNTTGKQKLRYSYFGYQSQELTIDLKNDTTINIELERGTTVLQTVIVKALPINFGAGISLPKQLTALELNNLPEFGGESGLVKGLQSVPGISSDNDGSVFFYVQGGGRDQNLVIIDDAPIFNPSHLLGFYSIVVPEFAKSITIHKNSIPANLGDRLSSVIDIRTQDGNLNTTQFKGIINPLMYRFSLETPLYRKRSSLFISYRRSTIEWLFPKRNGRSNLFFYDLHLKWNAKINTKNRVFYTFIRSEDKFQSGTNPVGAINWGNFSSTFRWNKVFGARLFMNTTISTGNYAYNLLAQPNNWKSELGTMSLKSDLNLHFSPELKTRFGVELSGYFHIPGKAVIDSTIATLPTISSNFSRKLVAYGQAELALTNQLNLTAGLRLINWSNIGPHQHYSFDESFEVADTIQSPQGPYNHFFKASPSISIEYQVSPDQKLVGGFGIRHQFLQLVLNSNSPFSAFEVWLPASPIISPQAASHWSLNYYLQDKKGVDFSIGTYYKLLRNQVEFESHATSYLNPLLEGELRFGNGRAYGLELQLSKSVGRLSGRMAYTYSRAFRTHPDLNNGKEYRATNDRPHEFSVLANYKLSDRSNLSFYWTSFSGSTFTAPIAFFEFSNEVVPVYGERNNDRLPTYHRLDLGIKHRLTKNTERKVQHWIQFSIYNAIAHKNSYVVKFNKQYSSQLSPEVQSNLLLDNLTSPSQTDLLRFFPSLSYSFTI
ncbi:TonB-dependent receptor [Chitinophagales bacterium]|nr:TonB-dependent receptor [Chitinophagales bacterium]